MNDKVSAEKALADFDITLPKDCNARTAMTICGKELAIALNRYNRIIENVQKRGPTNEQWNKSIENLGKISVLAQVIASQAEGVLEGLQAMEQHKEKPKQ